MKYENGKSLIPVNVLCIATDFDGLDNCRSRKYHCRIYEQNGKSNTNYHWGIWDTIA